MDEEKATVVEDMSSQDDMLAWRRQLARNVLRVLIVLGPIAVVWGCYDAYTTGSTWAIPLYLAAYAVLALVMFWKRIPYVLQAGAIAGLIYGMGVLDLVTSGRGGDGRVFLLAFPFVVTLFGRWREGLLALGLNVLTMTGLGLAFSSGHIILHDAVKQAASVSGAPWAGNTLVLVLLGAPLVISQDYLISRLADAAAHSRQLIRELKANQVQLDEQTRMLREREEELAQGGAKIRALLEVGRVASSILNLDELLARVVDLICERFGYNFAGVFLLDSEGKNAELRAGRGEAGRRLIQKEYKLKVGSDSMVGWTAGHRQARTALDAGAETMRVVDPLLSETRSEITLPLVVANRVLGVLDVQSPQENAFGEQDAIALQGLADQLAVALENARLFQEAQGTLGETESLYFASRRLTTATTTAEVADAITACVAMTEADGCTVMQFDFAPSGEPQALLYLGTWRRHRAPMFKTGLRLPISQSPFPFEMAGTLWIVTDVEKDETLPPSAHETLKATQVGALVNIPLQSKNKIIGQVVVLRTTSGPFTDAALRLYEMLSDQAAVALERALLLEETRRHAKEQEGLTHIAALASSTLEVSELLDRLMVEAKQLLGAEISMVLLEDQEKHALVGRYFSTEGASSMMPEEWRVSMDAPGFEQGIFARGGVYYSNQGVDDPNIIPAYRPYMEAVGVRNFCGAALRVRERSIGELYLGNRPGGFGREELGLMQAIAAYAANAIQNARLFEESQRQAARVQTINTIAARVRAGLTLEQVLNATVQEIGQTLGAARVAVRLKLPDDQSKPAS